MFNCLGSCRGNCRTKAAKTLETRFLFLKSICEKMEKGFSNFSKHKNEDQILKYMEKIWKAKKFLEWTEGSMLDKKMEKLGVAFISCSTCWDKNFCNYTLVCAFSAYHGFPPAKTYHPLCLPEGWKLSKKPLLSGGGYKCPKHSIYE